MYMVGLSHTTRMLYSTLTVMISVPAATKIMHWFVTIANGSVHYEMPFILTLFFIFYFITGGISGMNLAHTGMNILFHDTFYVIGHFHVLFAGAFMFSSFAAFYFYLPSVLGVKYNRFFTYCHIFYYSVGQLFTVAPMIWLGYLGMPRRVMDYPAAFGGWHSIISSAHMLTVAGILSFVFMLFTSLTKQHQYTIKTFGVGRVNTRLNYFVYYLARDRYFLHKQYPLIITKHKTYTRHTSRNFFNIEPSENTLGFFTFAELPKKFTRTITIVRGDFWEIGHYPEPHNRTLSFKKRRHPKDIQSELFSIGPTTAQIDISKIKKHFGKYFNEFHFRDWPILVKSYKTNDIIKLIQKNRRCLSVIKQKRRMQKLSKINYRSYLFSQNIKSIQTDSAKLSKSKPLKIIKANPDDIKRIIRRTGR